jgi:K+/H+ antiporter YhaU regulatory subunit KhtT
MTTQNYLPSKKLSIFLLIFLVILFSLFFFNKNKYSKNEAPDIKNISASTLVLNDQDMDGLYDWEESLWGTDPKQKDSDQDGVNDKEETEIKKNELGITTNQEDSSANQTDQLAKEIFSLAVSLNQNGLLTQEGVENLTKILGDQILTTEEIENPESEIQVLTTENTPENKEKYKTSVLKTIEVAKNKGFGGELTEFSKIIAEESDNTENLEKISQTYSDLADELIKIKVPEEISSIHKSLISELIRTSLSINLMSNYYSDPILSLRGIFLYKKYSDNVEKHLYSLLSYFQ